MREFALRPMGDFLPVLDLKLQHLLNARTWWKPLDVTCINQCQKGRGSDFFKKYFVRNQYFADIFFFLP